MAVISETELQRRLRALEQGKTSSGSSTFVRTVNPYGSGYTLGDSWYNAATNNLWLFDGETWKLLLSKLYLRYADSVSNVNTEGYITDPNDVTGFSEYPLQSDGTPKDWRGIFFGTDTSSVDPTDYQWSLISSYSSQDGIDLGAGVSLFLAYADDIVVTNGIYDITNFSYSLQSSSKYVGYFYGTSLPLSFEEYEWSRVRTEFYEVDTTPPPTPLVSNFTLELGEYNDVKVTLTEVPTYLQGNGHDFTHLYASRDNDINNAKEVAIFAGKSVNFNWEKSSAQPTLYLWAKYETADNVLSNDYSELMTLATYTVDLNAPPKPDDYTAPDAPFDLTTDGVATLAVTLPAIPSYTQGNGHYKTHIYISQLNDFNSASKAGSFDTQVGVITITPSVVYKTTYVWIRYESIDGVLSPVSNSQNIDTYIVDLTPPPTPDILTDITIYAGFTGTALILNSPPQYNEGHGHAITRVYTNSVNNPATSTEITSFTGVSGFIETNPSTQFYLWIKYESVDGGLSLFSSSTLVSTATDPSGLIAGLSESLSEDQFVTSLQSRLTNIDGTDPTTLASRLTAVDGVDGALATFDERVSLIDDPTTGTVVSLDTRLSVLDDPSTGTVLAIQGDVSSLEGKYTVKVDANGYVAGYGLAVDANTSTPTSSFVVVADKFAIAPVASSNPINDGAPFFHLTTPQNINGTDYPAGTYINNAQIADGSITTAQIGNATIDTAQITGKLSANKIDAGEITTDGPITINGSAGNAALTLTQTGQVISKGVGGRAVLDFGDVKIYKEVPNVGEVLYKALDRVESGTAQNNTTVTIPGYFTNAPKVIVSPANLRLYDTTYKDQSQTVVCQALNLSETATGSMSWQFTPKAELQLSAATGSTNISVGTTTSSSYTTGNFTTEANCTSITPSVYLASYRGNGSSQYYYRSVRWRVEYLSGSTFVNGSWNTTDFAADQGANITDAKEFNFPSAAAWTFRIRFEAYDTDGSVFGSVAYDYVTDTDTVSASVSSSAFPGDYQDSDSTTWSSNYSAPSGWEWYQTRYNIQFACYAAINGQNTFGQSVYATAYARVGSTQVEQKTFSSSSGGINSGTDYFTYNQTTTTPPAVLTLNTSCTVENTGFYATANATSSVSGNVYYDRRKLIVNSTTAVNNFNFDSYAYSLTSNEVLATGTLNWVALGD